MTYSSTSPSPFKINPISSKPPGLGADGPLNFARVQEAPKPIFTDSMDTKGESWKTQRMTSLYLTTTGIVYSSLLRSNFCLILHICVLVRCRIAAHKYFIVLFSPCSLLSVPIVKFFSSAMLQICC